jgi:nicotinamide mononucleotide adenylyltransferase
MDYTDAWKRTLQPLVEGMLDQYGYNVSMELIFKDKKSGSTTHTPLMLSADDDRATVHTVLDRCIKAISTRDPAETEVKIETP